MDNLITFPLLDLYTVIKNPSYICEHHFEPKFIVKSKVFNQLQPDAVPSIFKNFKSKKSKTTRNEKMLKEDTEK